MLFEIKLLSSLLIMCIQTFQAPLCLEAWDEALNEISKLSYEMILSPQNASALLKSMGDLPVLVVAGAEDVLVPLKSSQALASKLTNSVSFHMLFTETFITQVSALSLTQFYACTEICSHIWMRTSTTRGVFYNTCFCSRFLHLQTNYLNHQTPKTTQPVLFLMYHVYTDLRSETII